MSSATNKLNQAIERMTTGYKINGAKDNAANYSISQNMQTQLSSYDVAADNVAMGMDLVTTASDIISNMQDKASRLQALCTQARNGTYGAQSMNAINSEAAAIMAEINRLYMTAEYNNVSLFNREAPPELSAEHQALTETVCAKAEYNGFIADPVTYTEEQVAAMTRVKDVSSFSSGQKYAIYTKEELEKFRDYVNADPANYCGGVEFVLGDDIDLSSISNWTTIGHDWDYYFGGTFNGNGHVISNLTIDNPTENNQGLFGCAFTAGIMNVGIENCNIKGGSSTGGLVGEAGIEITNCYITGTVSGKSTVGGLAGGEAACRLTNCYTTASVSGNSSVGGLVGYGYATNCYATGNVSGKNFVGGLVGDGSATNCYATGNVSGKNCVGGLLGSSYGSSLRNCYATGNITGESNVGGLVGIINDHGSISDSASYSIVSGNSKVGAILGEHSHYSNDLVLNNVSAVENNLPVVGYYYNNDTSLEEPDKALACDELVVRIKPKTIKTTLQVGINSDNSNQIEFDTNFKFDLSALENNIASDEALATIMEFTNLLSEKSTQLGAVQNRLDSAIESIEVNLNNLTSSLSTIRDADIAEVSSEYIRQQILQQASATLLATANQSPSIALQLI